MTDQPFFLPALIVLALSIPLVMGLIPRNRLYGIRTRKTLADDRTWHAANRFGGWTLIVGSLIYLTLAFAVPYQKSARDNFLIWGFHLAVFVVPLAASAWATLRFVKKL